MVAEVKSISRRSIVRTGGIHAHKEIPRVSRGNQIEIAPCDKYPAITNASLAGIELGFGDANLKLVGSRK